MVLLAEIQFTPRMRQILLFMLGVLSGTATGAQVTRFSDTSNRWEYYQYSFDVSAYAYRQAQHWGVDTIIASKNYQVLLENNSPILALREDTAAQKIWFRFITPDPFPLESTDTLEHLLFDYHLAVGDTIHLSYGQAVYSNVVQDIDTSYLNGIAHRVWKLYNASENAGSYQFVEGIGCTKGIRRQISQKQILGSWDSQLQCFSNSTGPGTLSPPVPVGVWWPVPHGTPVQGNSWPVQQFDNNMSCKNALDVLAIEETEWKIDLPNPVWAGSAIRIPDGYEAVEFCVTDLSGQLVVKERSAGGATIPVGTIMTRPGLYFYTFRTASGAFQSGKLVVR